MIAWTRRRGPVPPYTIVELDRDYIARVMLPDLTHRYFDTPAGRQYEVAIVASDSGDVLYRSDDSARLRFAPTDGADFQRARAAARAVR